MQKFRRTKSRITLQKFNMLRKGETDINSHSRPQINHHIEKKIRNYLKATSITSGLRNSQLIMLLKMMMEWQGHYIYVRTAPMEKKSRVSGTKIDCLIEEASHTHEHQRLLTRKSLFLGTK